MGFKLKPGKLFDPSGFFSGDTTTKSLFDPGGEVVKSKDLDRITDPAGFFRSGIIDAPRADPQDLVTPFRRPLQERLVTNLFLGAGGPTQALSELARSRLLAQRGGIPAASTGISATARARLVGSTGLEETAKIQAKERAEEITRKKKALLATERADIFSNGGGSGTEGTGETGSSDDAGDFGGSSGFGGTFA